MKIIEILMKQMNVALPLEDFYVICNGKLIGDNETFISDRKYYLIPRLIGGKGGFGSMLRAIGAQIEKTTNREACRDLRGRRMRDVNNEKKLREWGEKIGEREREKMERRRLKRERVKNRGTMHKFEDEKYNEQKEQIKQNMEDALQQALSKEGDTKGKKKLEKGKLSRKEINFVFGEEISDLSEDEIIVKKAKICKFQDSEKSNIECTITEESSNSSTSSLNMISLNQTLSQAHNMITQEDSGLAFEMKFTSLNGQEKMIIKNDGSNLANTQIMNMQNKDTMEMVSIGTDVTMKNLNEFNIVTESIEKDISMKSESISDSVDESTLKKDISIKTTVDMASINLDSNDFKPVDLMVYSDVASLESLGLEQLKKELTFRGMKCGGSLNERATRLFSIKGLNSDQIPNNLKAKVNKK